MQHPANFHGEKENTEAGALEYMHDCFYRAHVYHARSDRREDAAAGRNANA